MNTIFYISKQKEMELNKNPEKAWEWFKGDKLLPFMIENSNDRVNVESIICYSEKRLSIIVKSDQKSIEHRDRSYQNGDGFHFVLAKPNDDCSASKEFYVIAISPLDESWRNKFVWYRNVDLTMNVLDKTRVEHNVYEDEHYFLVQIPWSEIEPLKALLYENYGFNISYVQSVEEGKNIYMLKEDPDIQSEQSSREYLVYEFQEPELPVEMECSVSLSSKHCGKENSVSLNIGINSNVITFCEVVVREDGDVLFTDSFEAKEGLTRKVLPFDTSKLNVGSHKLTIEVTTEETSVKEDLELFIYSETMFKDLSRNINNLRNDNNFGSLVDESIISLKFHYENLMKKFNELKAYEGFDDIYQYYQEICNDLEKVRMGEHLFQTGKVTRLGHESQIDGSLEPFSIYIPENSNKELKLLVFLHGSGSDDTFIKNNAIMHSFSEEHNLIILSPFARGTSHFYCTRESMEEVVELTKKVSEMFSINESNVLLGGFSMGGYGVYRIYDYSPKLFNGLVVFSGHHGIGKYFGGPDYNEEHHRVKFKEIPMIIFHGAEDRNCDYREQKPFFETMRDTYEHCEVHIKDDEGHSGLIKEWYPVFSEWMTKL